MRFATGMAMARSPRQGGGKPHEGSKIRPLEWWEFECNRCGNTVCLSRHLSVAPADFAESVRAFFGAPPECPSCKRQREQLGQQAA